MSGSTRIEAGHHENRRESGKERVHGIVDIEGLAAGSPRLAQLEEPGEIKNHGELGEFRWLDAGRAETNPAVRGVRTIEKENADEQDEDNAEAMKITRGWRSLR